MQVRVSHTSLFCKCVFDCHYISLYDYQSNKSIHNLNFPSSLAASTNEQRNPWKHLTSHQTSYWITTSDQHLHTVQFIHNTQLKTLSKANIAFATLGSKVTQTMTWMITVFLQPSSVTLSLVMQLSFSSLWLSHLITLKVFWILRTWLCLWALW